MTPAWSILDEIRRDCVIRGHDHACVPPCHPCLERGITDALAKARADKAERCARVLEQEMTIQYVNVSDLIDHLAQMIREQEGAHAAQA